VRENPARQDDNSGTSLGDSNYGVTSSMGPTFMRLGFRRSLVSYCVPCVCMCVGACVRACVYVVVRVIVCACERVCVCL
jgi:hypothetical protein